MTAQAFGGTRHAVAAWEDDGGARTVDGPESRNAISGAPSERRRGERRRLGDRRVARRGDHGDEGSAAIARTIPVSAAWHRCR
jgi:hypothetical protein